MDPDLETWLREQASEAGVSLSKFVNLALAAAKDEGFHVVPVQTAKG